MKTKKKANKGISQTCSRRVNVFHDQVVLPVRKTPAYSGVGDSLLESQSAPVLQAAESAAA